MFVRFCEDGRYAKEYHMAGLHRNPGHEADLREMIKLQCQQAKLLGYPHFAAYFMLVGKVTDPPLGILDNFSLEKLTRDACVLRL